MDQGWVELSGLHALDGVQVQAPGGDGEQRDSDQEYAQQHCLGRQHQRPVRDQDEGRHRPLTRFGNGHGRDHQVRRAKAGPCAEGKTGNRDGQMLERQ